MPPSHPWALHLNARSELQLATSFNPPDRNPPPLKYNDKEFIRPPDDHRVKSTRESVTLEDVIAFRRETLQWMAQSTRLSLSRSASRVVYRLTDIVEEKSKAILEAIHFEIFMPDRSDLRFLAITLDKLPPDACEGEYFKVSELKRTLNVCAMAVGVRYSVNWTVTGLNRINQRRKPVNDYLCISDYENDQVDRVGYCNRSDHFIFVRSRRFNKTKTQKSMMIDNIYNASFVDTSSAWIYPVEPPKNREEYALLVKKIRSSSDYPGTFPLKISFLDSVAQERIRKNKKAPTLPKPAAADTEPKVAASAPKQKAAATVAKYQPVPTVVKSAQLKTVAVAQSSKAAAAAKKKKKSSAIPPGLAPLTSSFRFDAIPVEKKKMYRPNGTRREWEENERKRNEMDEREDALLKQMVGRSFNKGLVENLDLQLFPIDM